MYAHQRIPVPSTFDDDYATRSAAARRAAMRAALEHPQLLAHPRFAKRLAGSFVRR